MKVRQVVWPKPVRSKLLSYRSEFFTPEETFDYIVQVILGTEDLLLNPVFTKSYTEEFGEYAGLMRVVIRKFRFFVEFIGEEAVVVAVKCPGEN